MLSRLKLGGSALIVVLVLGAISTSAASASFAPRWTINGSYLGSGSTQNYIGNLSGTMTFTVPGLLSLQSSHCSIAGKIVGSSAGVSGTTKEGVLSCTNLTVSGAPACEVQNITTGKMDGIVGWREESGEANILTFEPESGVNIATVLIEECALEGEYTITGGFVGTIEPAATEVEEGTLRFGGSDNTTTEHWFTPTTPVRSTMSSPHSLFGGRLSALSGSFGFRIQLFRFRIGS